jgi:hypothetical protein
LLLYWSLPTHIKKTKYEIIIIFINFKLARSIVNFFILYLLFLYIISLILLFNVFIQVADGYSIYIVCFFFIFKELYVCCLVFVFLYESIYHYNLLKILGNFVWMGFILLSQNSYETNFFLRQYILITFSVGPWWPLLGFENFLYFLKIKVKVKKTDLNFNQNFRSYNCLNKKLFFF